MVALGSFYILLYITNRKILLVLKKKEDNYSAMAH